MSGNSSNLGDWLRSARLPQTERVDVSSKSTVPKLELFFSHATHRPEWVGKPRTAPNTTAMKDPLNTKPTISCQWTSVSRCLTRRWLWWVPSKPSGADFSCWIVVCLSVREIALTGWMIDVSVDPKCCAQSTGRYCQERSHLSSLSLSTLAYVKDLIIPYQTKGSVCCSQLSGYLLFPESQALMWGRAFGFRLPSCRTSHPAWVWDTDTLFAFNLIKKLIHWYAQTCLWYTCFYTNFC